MASYNSSAALAYILKDRILTGRLQPQPQS
jgi:hypothetical protein